MEYYQPEAVVLQCGADSLSGDRLVSDVRDSIPERKVDGIILARADTYITKLSGSREIFAVLVE